jgi:radical SAM superfamily enzyme YgiQ (UPF0313 family)
LIARGNNISWSLPAGTRSEVLDQETLSLISESGCNYLVYAPESGSRRSLELIKKRITLERITESMRTAKQIGLVLRGNLIIGFPHETRVDVYQTLWYGLKLTWMGVDEVPIFIYSAYPGAEIFDGLLADGVIELNDEYFLSLTSLNSKFTLFGFKTNNPHITPLELAFYRTTFTLLNYVVGYLRYPTRIVRTLRNLFSDGGAATVLEHRLRDAIRRRRAGGLEQS